MNLKFLFFLFPLLVSCRSNNDQCTTLNEREIRAIDEMMNSSISYDSAIMPLLTTYDQIIQYHGYEGWGGYVHTIRLYQENQQYFIELKSNVRKGPDRTVQTVRKKIELEQDEVERVWVKANLLYCKEVDLDPDIIIMDGFHHHLFLKNGMRIQGFEWQLMHTEVRHGRIPKHKSAVTEIVGDLMRLCEFPNGEKFIEIDSSHTSKDSVAYVIFLGNAYNVLDYKVYFDNKQLEKNVDGLALTKISVKDTSNLSIRIRITVKLLDKREVEF